MINKLFYFQLHAECATIRMVDLLVVVAILYVLHLPVVVSIYSYFHFLVMCLYISHNYIGHLCHNVYLN